MTVLEFAVANLACQLGLTLPDARDLTVRFIEYTRRLAQQGAFDYAQEQELQSQEENRTFAREDGQAPRQAPAGAGGQADADQRRAAGQPAVAA